MTKKEAIEIFESALKADIDFPGINSAMELAIMALEKILHEPDWEKDAPEWAYYYTTYKGVGTFWEWEPVWDGHEWTANLSGGMSKDVEIDNGIPIQIHYKPISA